MFKKRGKLVLCLISSISVREYLICYLPMIMQKNTDTCRLSKCCQQFTWQHFICMCLTLNFYFKLEQYVAELGHFYLGAMDITLTFKQVVQLKILCMVSVSHIWRCSSKLIVKRCGRYFLLVITLPHTLLNETMRTRNCQYICDIVHCVFYQF